MSTLTSLAILFLIVLACIFLVPAVFKFILGVAAVVLVLGGLATLFRSPFKDS